MDRQHSLYVGAVLKIYSNTCDLGNPLDVLIQRCEAREGLTRKSTRARRGASASARDVCGHSCMVG
jgi:hypothetical protein